MSIQLRKSFLAPLVTTTLLAGHLAGCSDDDVSGGGGAGAGGGTSSSMPTGGGPTTSSGVDWTTVNHLTLVDLGTIDTSKDPEIELDIPDKTLGFTLVADIDEADGRVGISEMSRVGAQNVVENFDLPGRSEPQFLGPQSVAAQNPQTDLPDAMPLATGAWRARLKAEEPVKDVRARLLVRRTSDGLFHGGAVDVAVRVAPEAATQAYVEEVLAAMFDGYVSPQVGLDEGDVSFEDLAAEYSSIDTDPEFREMVRTAVSDPKYPQWNLFVVTAIPIFPDAYAFAGGLPGSLLPGTSTNAVVWVPTGSVELDAVVLAHEYGHLAGLFHVREFSGGNEDVLGDTVFGDTTNILRPAVSLTATTFSPEQITVVRGSALYRGILEEGGTPGPSLGATGGPAPKWRQHAEIAPRVPTSELEALLASHWCARAPGLLGHIWSEARGQGDALLDLAVDDGAPPFVRLRAILLVDRFGESPQRTQADELVRRLAFDSKTPAALRGWASRRVGASSTKTAADRGGR
jgi:hypothetical protein